MDFKYLQEIIVLNMLIHGERQDVGGRFICIKTSGEKVGQAEVEVNTIRLHYPLDRIVDAVEYWDKKHGRKV
jgi:hypothetical protein